MNNNTNPGRSSYRGRGRGRGGRSHGPNTGNANLPPTKFRPCKSFTLSGSCHHGNSCHFSHILKLHKSIDNSIAQNSPVSTIAIWNHGSIQIFTGAHDGYWRLWNTADNFNKLVEHNMNGKIEAILIQNDFLFCAFEAPCAAVPNVPVGMVHVWNLQQPATPPLELHTATPLLPYAHNQAVTAITLADNIVATGSKDGTIRFWKLEQATFTLLLTLPGHARQVTGLVFVGKDVLWSSSTDGTIRIWNATNGTCQHVITAAQQGHSNAVTGLLALPNEPAIVSTSLDGTIKLWNASNGSCLASQSHGSDGVVSISISEDSAKHLFLIAGLESGLIVGWTRDLQTALFAVGNKLQTVGHNGAVQAITGGPSATFYTGGADGKVLVFECIADLGIS